MAIAETAKLAVEIGLVDKLTPGIKRMESRMSGLGLAARKTGKVIGAGLAIGVGAVGIGVKTGLDNLAELETAVTSVDGAIAQMGLTGKVTGKQIADWAAVIEDSVGAAFDEKPIAQATGTLIRYGKLAPTLIQPAMQVMTDLAAKTGDVDSAATLLAKALADPEKAAGKLARQGVVLTKAEQDQIKAFMKAGKQGKAQELILKSLAKTTKGAALASQGPYARSQAMLADTVEHATMALAEGFLPVIERVRNFLRTKLSDPKAMQSIRDFGKGMADAFDKVVSFAERIPWGAVVDGMKALGNGAKMALDAFTAMPSWVQAAVVGGWGLNKLTGGALQDVIGSLASGLVKGVLGMTAGVVNINAGVVNGGGGGLPGKGGGGVPGVPAAGGLGAAAMTVLAPASIAALVTGIGAVMFVGIPKLVTTIYGTGGGNEGTPMKGKLGPSNGLTTPIFEAQMGALLRGVNTSKTDTLATLRANQAKDQGQAAQMLASMNGVKGGQAAALVAFRAAERTFANQKPPTVNVSTNVKVSVTASDVKKSVVVHDRYGERAPSRNGGTARIPS